MFYVYEWYVVETGDVIYVGKGTRNRYKAKKKNALLNTLLEAKKCDVRIIEWYNTEKEAFEAERKRILALKEIGQAICNKLTYSTGGVNSIWTEERRKYMSDHNPMRRKDQRERMSNFNPMKDKEVAMRVGMTKRKPIFIGENKFSCAKEAASQYGVCTSTIWGWVRSGVRKSTGENCGYIEKEKEKTPEIKTQILTHTIIYDGKEFETAKEAAKYVGVRNPATILRWCRNGYSSEGVSCHFKDDETQYVYVPPNKVHTNKQVIVDGVLYNSIKDASEHFGVSKYVFKKHFNYTEYKQGNQQPSQGKSDYSTLEGSTTNG